MEHDYEVMKLCVVSYLRELRTKNDAKDDMAMRIRILEARLALTGLGLEDNVSSSVSVDAIPNGVAELIELRSELATRMVESEREYADAELMCMANNQRFAVWLHVMRRLTWLQVADSLHCHETTARNWARTGICEIYAEMPEAHRRQHIPNAAPL